MQDINTKELDRQEANSVKRLNNCWSTYHAGIARDYGVCESIFVSYVWKWIKYNSRKGKNFHGDRHWTFGSLQFLMEAMPHWTHHQIRCAIKKCHEKGLILIERLSPNKYDKTHSYTLTDLALHLCEKADQNPIILNFQERLDLQLENNNLNEEIKILKERLALLSSSETEHSELSDRCDKKRTSLHSYELSNRIEDPRKEEYIDIVCLIGDSSAQDLDSKKQTLSFKINDLHESEPKKQAVDNFNPISENHNISSAYSARPNEASEEFLLSHSHGCSEELILEYRQMRRSIRATLTEGAWLAVGTCLQRATERLGMTFEEALKVLVESRSGNTRFDVVFEKADRDAQQDAAVKKLTTFMKKYNMARGQTMETVISDIERKIVEEKLSSQLPGNLDLEKMFLESQNGVNHFKIDSDQESSNHPDQVECEHYRQSMSVKEIVIPRYETVEEDLASKQWKEAILAQLSVKEPRVIVSASRENYSKEELAYFQEHNDRVKFGAAKATQVVKSTSCKGQLVLTERSLPNLFPEISEHDLVAI